MGCTDQRTGEEGRIDLLIVDDHAVVREGLEAMLSTAPSIGAISTAASGAEAMVCCERDEPQVVLLDVRMPGSDGFEILKRLCQRWPQIRVLMLSSGSTPSEVMLARQRGAAGYLNKSVNRDALLAAIERVAVGGAAFQLATPGGEDPVVLSPRELEVLNQLGRGLGNKELGVALGVGGETIKNHLKAVFLKLEVSGRAEAVARGYELGLISAASQP